jgi:hypothetical protein
MLKMKIIFSDILFIILNLIPLFGVLFLEWDTIEMFLVYCLESLIIGFYNVVKMVIVAIRVRSEYVEVKGAKFRMNGLLFIIFFILIYWLLCYISTSIFTAVTHYGPYPEPLSYFLKLPKYLSDDGRLLIFLFLIMHCFYMFEEFIYFGNYKTATLNGLLLQPFSRVILTQCIVMLGAVLLQFFSIKMFMVIFVGVRLCVEIYISVRNNNANRAIENLSRNNIT